MGELHEIGKAVESEMELPPLERSVQIGTKMPETSALGAIMALNEWLCDTVLPRVAAAVQRMVDDGSDYALRELDLMEMARDFVVGVIRNRWEEEWAGRGAGTTGTTETTGTGTEVAEVGR